MHIPKLRIQKEHTFMLSLASTFDHFFSSLISQGRCCPRVSMKDLNFKVFKKYYGCQAFKLNQIENLMFPSSLTIK